MMTQGTGLWDTEIPRPLCKGAEPSLSHAREPHSFFYFLSDLQKQKYLLANYEGPESSYWVHISLTLISEWMAASSVSWLAFKHADCWASLDSELTISKKKIKKKKIPEHKKTPPQTLLRCYWANFPPLLHCKFILWNWTCTSSVLCQGKQLGSLGFFCRATIQ